MVRQGGRTPVRVAITGVAALAATAALAVPTAAPAYAASATPSPSASAEATPSAAAPASPEPTPSAAAEPEPEPAPETSAAPQPSPAPDAETPEPEPQPDPQPETPAPPEPDEPAAPPAPAEEWAPTSPEAEDAPVPRALPEEGTPAPGPLDPVEFTDVSADMDDAVFTAFADGIMWAGESGLARGWPDGDGGRAFRADEELTRAQLAAFLFRLAGSPEFMVPDDDAFTDIDGSAGRAEIAWLASTGIDVGAVTDGARVFRPGAAVTRTELARVLHRYAGAPAYDDVYGAMYYDVDAATEGAEAINWLAATVGAFGWDGQDGREFRGNETISRGAVATILMLLDEQGVEFTEWEAPRRLVGASEMTVDADILNLRSGPSLDAEVVTQGLRGAVLATTGTVAANGWVQVELDGARLWASAEYLAGGNAVAAVAVRSAFDNGRIPLTELCELSWASGHRLECQAAEDAERLNAAFRERYGMDIPITDSYRDYEGQVRVKLLKGYLAATPGTSNHGWGKAIDINGGALPGGYAGEAYAWLVSTLPSYDWVLPRWARPDGSKPEPWHLEHTG